MGLYERYIVPKIIDWSMRNKRLSDERRRFVPLASGRVLEIGIGSGLNLPFYSSRVERLFGLEPSTQMRRMASRRIEDAPFPVDFLGLSGERRDRQPGRHARANETRLDADHLQP
ncbi:MAG: class I SAM-dependent methyltransferase, partial [Proteobacteria bacterium]|nr:class I SAM-dependent methyltransferase [Pseudomonadota bacterium]